MTKTQHLTNPRYLYSRSEVLSNPCPVPEERGVYAWYFKDIPGNTPSDGCITKDDLTLLYVGISPKSNRSRENLRKRISYHYKGNAGGSTLRLSLGILLTGKSGFPLRRVGSGKRMTFTHLGEQWLDKWMDRNASVCWVKHPEPWRLEDELLNTLSLPLNIQGNSDHFFVEKLCRLRKEATRSAREEPIVDEGKQQRTA